MEEQNDGLLVPNQGIGVVHSFWVFVAIVSQLYSKDYTNSTYFKGFLGGLNEI